MTVQSIGLRTRSSVFLKLFFVLLLAGILINLLVFLGIRHLFAPKIDQHLRDNIQHYARLVVAEIAKPGGRESAQEMSRTLGLDFVVEQKSGTWTTAKSLPTMDKILAHQQKSEGLPFMPLGSVRPALLVNQEFPEGTGKVAIFLPSPPLFQPNWSGVMVLLAALSTIVIVIFATIRGILRPLKGLSDGVARIAKGDFEHLVEFHGSDEIGRLAKAFNEMTLKLKLMIESKRQLLIDVSHELRSPLARARVALEFISDETIRKSVTDEIEEMSNLIHQLLEGAQMDSGLDLVRLEKRDLVALVGETASKFRAHGHQVCFTSHAPSAQAAIDDDRIRMVVRNLLENAIKYSPQAAPIDVEVSVVDNQVEISVRDRGIGIPNEDLERIFESFYRVDRSRTRATGGFGLGLSLCKKIVNAHRGTIGVESTEGVGSRFWLRLPYAP